MEFIRMLVIVFIFFLVGCFFTDNIEYKFAPHCSIFESTKECQTRIGDEYTIVLYSNGYYQPVKKQ